LTIAGTDAAGLPVADTTTVHIDNSQPTVSFSGPTDALSTSGTQYVTAVGGGSTSGIYGLSCTVDGGAGHWYPGAVARVPVSGVGQHTVACSAADNAVDAAGNHGSSAAPAIWHIGIREPTTLVASLARTLDAARCHMHVVTVTGRGHARRVTVVRCSTPVVRRRVGVDGHWRWRTVHLSPHVHYALQERVAFGHRSVVSGWLGVGNVPLAGQPVAVLSAPDNGLGQFSTVAIALTAENGTWGAQIPAGPSRLIVATYSGDATQEPATSTQLRVTVPARIILRVRPGRTSWARQLVITGRLLGGYVPTDQTQASQLLKIRIGVVGLPRVRADVGVPDLSPDGRFRTTFCLAPGRGVVRYWFSAVTLYETNYPYLGGSQSKRFDVTVGPGSARRRACG
jgi:hypothetical protein